MSKQYYIVSGSYHRYGLFHLLFDIFMLVITSGLWVIWIIIRELRRF